MTHERPTGLSSGDLPVSTAVIRAVAGAEDCSIAELPSVHDAVDAEALDAPVSFNKPTTTEFNGLARFRYAGYIVTVWPDGEVELRELREE